MNVVLILLAASLTIAIGFLAAFIWSVKNGQYEDDYTPSVRMLFDDEKPAGYSATKQPAADPASYPATEAAGRKHLPSAFRLARSLKKTTHTK